MGLFDRFWGKKSLPAGTLNTEAPTLFYSVNELLGSLMNCEGYIRTNTVLGQSAAFAKASIVDAILFEKVSAIKDARYYFYNTKGDEIERPLEMERVMTPNSYEDFAQFVAKIEFFSQLYGKAYVAKIKPEGVKGVALHVLPNPLVTENIKTSGISTMAPRSNLLGYTVKLDGKYTIELTPDEVVEINDVSYSLTQFGGSASRLVSLEEPINTFIASYSATNELLSNRGMLGIITAKGKGASEMLYTKEESDQLLQDVEKRYGITRGRAKFAISSRDLSYIPISSTIKDLGVGEIRENAKKDICYTYQIPSVLLDVSGSTYDNYAEAKKKLYASDIIPSAANIASTMSKVYGFNGFTLKATFDHLDFFQDAKRAQAAGLTSLVQAMIQAEQAGLVSHDMAEQTLLKYLTD